MNVYECLAFFQANIECPKDKVSKQGYSYRSVSGITEGFNELKRGDDVPEEIKKCSLIFDEDTILIKDELWTACTAQFIDGKGEKIEAHHKVKQNWEGKYMQVEQKCGSASSYARKYAATGLLSLEDEENDPDQIDVGQIWKTVEAGIYARWPDKDLTPQMRNIVNGFKKPKLRPAEAIELQAEAVDYWRVFDAEKIKDAAK